MAGTARELVTKVTFNVDNASLKRTQGAITDLKKELERLGSAVDKSVNSSLVKVRQNVTKTSMEIDKLKQKLDSLKIKDVNAKSDGGNRGGLKSMTVNNLKATITNLNAKASNVGVKGTKVIVDGFKLPNKDKTESITNLKATITNLTARASNAQLKATKVDAKSNIAKITSSQTEVKGGNVSVADLKLPAIDVSDVNLRNLRVMHADRVYIKGNISGGGGSGGGGGGSDDDENTPSIADLGSNLAAGGAAATAVGMAMMAPTAYGLKIAMDYDAIMSMVKAKATTGMSEEDAAAAMKNLDEYARYIGTTTRFTDIQAAQATNYAASMGWKTEEITGGGLKGAVDLAIAGQEDVALTTKIIAQTLNALHMTASDAPKLADAMAAAVSNSSATIKELGVAFGYAANVAGNLGYSEKDLIYALSLMMNSGVNGSKAGTAFQTIATRMATNHKATARAMAILGIDMKKVDENGNVVMKPLMELIDEGRAKFTEVDPERNLAMIEELTGSKATDKKKALAILTKIKESGGKITEDLDMEFANAFGGLWHMGGALALFTGPEERKEIIKNAIINSEGAAAKMAETTQDNLPGSLVLLQSAIDALAHQIGDIFSPILKDLADTLTPIIRSIGEFAKEHPKLTAAIFGTVTAVGALLVVLGSLGMLVGNIMQLVPVFTALGGLLGAGGWSGLFAGMAASIRALLTTLLTPFAFLGGKIKALIMTLLTPVRAVANLLAIIFRATIGEWLTARLPLITQFLRTIVAALGGPIMVAILALGAALYYVYNHWEEVKASFAESLPELEAAINKIKYAWESIQPAVDTAASVISYLVDLIGKGLVFAIEIMWKAAVKAFGALAEVINTAAWAFNGIKEFFGNTAKAAANQATSNYSSPSYNYNTYEQNNQFSGYSPGQAADFVRNSMPTAYANR